MIQKFFLHVHDFKKKYQKNQPGSGMHDIHPSPTQASPHARELPPGELLRLEHPAQYVNRRRSGGLVSDDEKTSRGCLHGCFQK